MRRSASFISAEFSSVVVITAGLASVAVIGVLDFLTGYQISFAVFYLLPVGVASWYATKRWGLVLAFGSSLVWYVAEIAAGYPYLHPSIPIWNAFVRLVFFVIIALLLSALRNRFIAEMRLAKTDALTGLSNSRAFREQLDHDLALMARSGDPLSLVYIDLDDFKSINDSYGHGAGDELLRHVADKLVESTRRSDTVARLGGDEFALILPATNLDGALSLTRKLEQVFQPLGEKGRAVTCSIGAVVFDQRQPTADEAVAAADRLMYAAKAGGKNRRVVRCYSELAPEPTAVPLDMSAAQVSANPAIAGR